MNDWLIELNDVSITYQTAQGLFQAVHHASFKAKSNETIAIIGESGSGKSSLGRAIVRLEKISSGSIIFDNTTISEATGNDVYAIRKQIHMVFQDPEGSFNPKYSAAWHLNEVFLTHFPKISDQEKQDQIHAIIDQLHIPRQAIAKYAHELSGGQKQRLLLARALLCQPKLIILDEPVASVDTILRPSLIALLKQIQQQHQLCYICISHDFSLVHSLATSVIVMYRGHIIEMAPTHELHTTPVHPYTISLLSCIPSPYPHTHTPMICPQVRPPSVEGCCFAHRCPFAIPICHLIKPELSASSTAHHVACHRSDEIPSLRIHRK